MKVERQRDHECLLATMAALSGARLEDVRATACRLAGVENWVEIRGNLAVFWDVAEQVAMALGGANLWSMVGPGHTVRGMVPGATVTRLNIRNMRRLPAKGRGTVSFRRRQRGGKVTSHIMPWKDGIIYDPENPDTPRTLTQYRKVDRRFKLFIVTLEA